MCMTGWHKASFPRVRPASRCVGAASRHFTAMLRHLAGVTALLAAASAAAVDLSPGHWPTAERADLQQADFFFIPPYPGTVKGGSFLVSGTLSPVAVHTGLEVLRQGGTAADAAATVALTAITLELGFPVSYAGELQLLYFEARTNRVYSLDGGWGTYAHELDPGTIPATDMSSLLGLPAEAGAGTGELGRQTLVPGFMAGIQALHARFGRLKFTDLFQPAIWYAENGVTISPLNAAWFQQGQPQIWRTPEGRHFASMPDGSLPKVGDLFRQPDLARTLKAVASKGAAYMYTGEWARHFVAAVRANGGRVTPEDLAHYKPIWREPVSVAYAGATVFGPGDDSSGSRPVLEALNLLSGLRVQTLGPYWHDPVAFKAYVQALRFVIFGRWAPEIASFESAHGFSSDLKTRLTPQFTDAVVPQLAKLLHEPGATGQAGHHTQGVVVIDRWGNVAALVHSITANGWGDTGIVVDGIPIADQAAVFRWKLTQIKPGAMVWNEMSPVIALKDGKPVLAVASAGVSMVPETTRLVAGALAGSADLQSLMSAPPLLLNLSPWQPGQTLSSLPELTPGGAYDKTLLKAIASTGVTVSEASAQSVASLRGTAAMAVIDQPTGIPRAVEVPRVHAFAESELQRGIPVPQPAQVALTERILNRYVGNYRSSPDAVIRVTRDDNSLFEQLTGSPRARLYPDSESQFHSGSSDAELIFRFDPASDTTDLVVRHNSYGFESFAPRMSDTEAAALESHLAAPSQSVPEPPTLPTVEGMDGDWEGTITDGSGKTLELHIESGVRGTSGRLGLPSQHLFGSLIAPVSRQGNHVTLLVKSMGAAIDGELSGDGNTVTGSFTAFGMTRPVTLSRRQ